ncbi:hypothetical protein OS493_002765 [Desmophyllum pertusum]|uniref:Uncharacterized protein n=1 Tax=Desmophyllum pertusum TaxID=174260 RepID=A0A9X0CI32_9CNID|nr:hypothetical protein OS493_002765 [Desmophyllum pertusum]
MPPAKATIMDRTVKFPHDLVFHDMVKDGDPSEMCQFLKTTQCGYGDVGEYTGRTEQPRFPSTSQGRELKMHSDAGNTRSRREHEGRRWQYVSTPQRCSGEHRCHQISSPKRSKS